VTQATQPVPGGETANGGPPDVVGWLASRIDRLQHFVFHVGGSTLLAKRTIAALFTTRFEFRSFVYQIEQLGVRSFSIGAATAVFVGIVMAIQFAFSLEKFGAKDSVGRIVALAFVRELGPALTSLVVGSRIAAGMTAEIGSMQVTEQIDAIRALGADPVRKLVVPRMLAGIVIMPLLSTFALVFGIASAMVVCQLSFGISPPFFISSALDAVTMQDMLSGIGKTPFFGFLVTLLGCYFGFDTRGGTEGVGKSTTTSVVVVSITVLIADALLTQIFLSI
jgi:phospholipid/cholesterol/gamma-HCH transport system permease protein